MTSWTSKLYKMKNIEHITIKPNEALDIDVSNQNSKELSFYHL